MFRRIKELILLNKSIQTKKNELSQLEDTIASKDLLLEEMRKEMCTKIEEELEVLNKQVSQKDAYISDIEAFKIDYEKYEKQIVTQKKKLAKIKTLYKAMDTAVEQFFHTECEISNLRLPEEYLVSAEELAPSVTLKLHSMDVKELRKAFKQNDKLIHETLKKYEGRYTTKANSAIYKLMVVALEAELQNILYNIKFSKLNQSIDLVKETTAKYLAVASEGNQSIAPTLVKFIGEIECLFIEAVKIEYEYYVQKERQKEQQAILREQMRQEAEERRVLEQQKKQVEKEEEKYKVEILKVQEAAAATDDQEKLAQLQARINELQMQLDNVEHKKEEIISRQNGQAGYVYIISNLGAFGDDVFKVGMTRRLDPIDRINELSGASVPFAFDIHSFIFSNNAVELEQKLHTTLNDHRVNKVNLRKEFFKVSLDTLENLVNEIDPTAEFNRTMLAEHYRQTLSMNEEKTA